MRTTRDVRAPRAPRARRPPPPARRALAHHGAATEEKTRDEDDDRRRDARRVARGSGAFHVRDEEGGGFTICHRRTLRACPKLSSRRHEYKVEVRVHTSCGAGRGTRAECVCRLFFAIDEAES